MYGEGSYSEKKCLQMGEKVLKMVYGLASKERFHGAAVCKNNLLIGFWDMKGPITINFI